MKIIKQKNQNTAEIFGLIVFVCGSFLFISIPLQRLRHIVHVGGLEYSDIADSTWLLVPEIYYVPVSLVYPPSHFCSLLVDTPLPPIHTHLPLPSTYGSIYSTRRQDNVYHEC